MGTNVAPQGQTLQVISETPKNFTVSTQLVTPSNVPNWITVNGASSTSGATGQPSSFVTVGASPASLGVGLYQGVIRVTLEGVAPIDIDVFLRVSAAPQVALNVPSVNIAGTAGSQVSVLLPVSSTTLQSLMSRPYQQYYGASGWLSVTSGFGKYRYGRRHCRPR